MSEGTFRQVVVRFWALGHTFHGRSSRAEYWGWSLINLAVWALLVVVIPLLLGNDAVQLSTGALGPFFGNLVVFSSTGPSDHFLPLWLALLDGAWGIATLIPTFALLCRRLHDANFSGWWTVLALIPPVSLIPVLMCLRRSQAKGARFDREPALESVPA